MTRTRLGWLEYREKGVACEEREPMTNFLQGSAIFLG
jgi:hypothetical protein